MSSCALGVDGIGKYLRNRVGRFVVVAELRSYLSPREPEENMVGVVSLFSGDQLKKKRHGSAVLFGIGDRRRRHEDHLPPPDFINKIILLIDGDQIHVDQKECLKEIKTSIQKTLELNGFPSQNAMYILYGNTARDNPHRVRYVPQAKDAGMHHVETQVVFQGIDSKLIHDLNNIYLKGPPCYLVLVTGDADMKGCLETAIEKGFKVLVIGGRKSLSWKYKKDYEWVEWEALRFAKGNPVPVNRPQPPPQDQ